MNKVKEAQSKWHERSTKEVIQIRKTTDHNYIYNKMSTPYTFRENDIYI